MGAIYYAVVSHDGCFPAVLTYDNPEARMRVVTVNDAVMTLFWFKEGVQGSPCRGFGAGGAGGTPCRGFGGVPQSSSIP